MPMRLEDIPLPGLRLSRHPVAGVRGGAMRVQRTLGGRDVLWPAPGGEALDLEGDEATGWLAWETVARLRRLADQAGASALVLTLEDGATLSVRFRHEDAPVILAEPVLPGAVLPDDPCRRVGVKLMEVAA